jgi:hypothetical protein
VFEENFLYLTVPGAALLKISRQLQYLIIYLLLMSEALPWFLVLCNRTVLSVLGQVGWQGENLIALLAFVATSHRARPLFSTRRHVVQRAEKYVEAHISREAQRECNAGGSSRSALRMLGRFRHAAPWMERLQGRSAAHKHRR